MKKTLLWAGCVLAFPIVLFVLLTVLFYIPPIQRFVVRQSAQMASESLGMNVSIEKARISFPINLEFQNVLATQDNDTILSVERLVADVPVGPLWHGKVDLNGVELLEARFNTFQLIESVKISGELASLGLDCRSVDLEKQHVNVPIIDLKGADLLIQMNDSVPEDSTSEPVPWIIDLQQVRLTDTHLGFCMDSLSVRLKTRLGDFEKIHLSLPDNLYKVASARLDKASLALNLNAFEPAEGLDYNHLAFDSVFLDLKSFSNQGQKLSLDILSARMVERCGLRFNSLSGSLGMDEKAIHAHDVQFSTPFSQVTLEADVDWESLQEGRPDARMHAALDATVGKSDILAVLGPTLAETLQDVYPDRPLTARLNISGNVQQLQLDDTHLHLQDIISANASGSFGNMLDEAARIGSVKLDLLAENLDFLPRLYKWNGVAIPHGITANGNLSFAGSQYGFEGLIQQSKGKVKLSGSYNILNDHYMADLKADSLNLHDFLPNDSIFYFSGDVLAQGRGTDVYASGTQADFQATLRQLQYGAHRFEGVEADLQLVDHQLKGKITSCNAYLQLDGDVDAYLLKNSVAGKLDVDVAMLDAHRLNVARDSMVWSFRFNVEAQTNVRDSLFAKASLTDVQVATRKRTFTPKNLYSEFLTHPDTVFAHVEAGDFYLDIQTQEGIDTLMSRIDTLQSMFVKQYQQKRFSVAAVQSAWPRACIKMRSGSNNPFSNFFAFKGYAFKKLNLHFDVSPEEGLDGDLDIFGMRADSILLDTIKMVVEQQDTVLRFNGQVRNNRYNPQFVFDAKVVGRLMADGAMARLNLFDAKNKMAIDLATRARFVEEGLRFTFHPDHPILAYQTYNLNKDGYVLLRDDGQIQGSMSVLTDEGMGFVFKAMPEEQQKQNMHLEFSKLDLDTYTSVLPYVPHLTGILNGEVWAKQPLDGALTANGVLRLKDLTYEGSPMGENMEVALNYEPKDNDVYQIVGTLRRNGEFVTTLGGDYNSLTGELDLETILYRFPADMVNGFIPDHIAGMRGIMEGRFHVEGNTRNPVVNGTLTTDSVSVYSDMYAVNLRVEDKTLEISNSRLSLRNLNLLSEKNDKMTLNGTIDFRDTERILMNVSLRANNFQIIDKPRNAQTLLYGKAYVGANATLSGPLDELKLRGTVNLLGTSDVTYVLKDSPLTVEDRLNDLVTFVDFNDTILVTREVAKKDISGVDATLNIQIDEGAKVSCDLSNNRESYVDLIGGGSLVMRYTADGKILLNGRYTINNGEMKYALPVIPLKTFTLGSGSYVEFTGDMMNPKLSISATEKTRASVSNGEGAGSRSVDFEVGVSISNTLNDMGLEFTIDAPQDMAVQNELSIMSKEMKGKLAVTMLATGLYMADNNTTNGLSMNSALNSFLQSEISSIAGNALQSVDLSFGMEDGTTRDGRTSTDYSFRFAKRLWGNRVSIIVGGKVSSGTNVDNGSFIDDISLEYRLDNSGTRYVRLFHEKNFDRLLDGEVLETGAGVVLRKKMTRLGELFIFKNSAQRERINLNRERRRESAVETGKIGHDHESDEEHKHHHENVLLEKAEEQRRALDQKLEKKQE